MRVLFLIARRLPDAGRAAPPAAVNQLDVRVPMRDGVRLSANVYRPPDLGAFRPSWCAPPTAKATASPTITRHSSTAATPSWSRTCADATIPRVCSSPWSRNPPTATIPSTGSRGTLERRQGRDDGRIVSGDRPVEGRRTEQPAFESDLSGGLGLRRLSRPVLLHRRRHETRQPPNWMADNLRAPGFVPEFDNYVLHLPLRTSDVAATGQTSDMYQTALRHPAYDSFWKSISTREQLAKIRIPVFSVGRLVRQLRPERPGGVRRPQQDLRRTPRAHRSVAAQHVDGLSGRGLRQEFHRPVRTLQLEWFDQWLKGKDSPLLSTPPVRLFLMGSNRWLEERQWPPQSVRVHAVLPGERGPRQFARRRRRAGRKAPAPRRSG